MLSQTTPEARSEMPSGMAHRYRNTPAPRSPATSSSAIANASKVWSGMTTPANTRVILTASPKWMSLVMRLIGSRLQAPASFWKASTSAWTIGARKKTARNSSVGATSRYGATSGRLRRGGRRLLDLTWLAVARRIGRPAGRLGVVHDPLQRLGLGLEHGLDVLVLEHDAMDRFQ